MKAIATGKLFGGLVDCYVLEDGRRVLSVAGAGRCPPEIATALVACDRLAVEMADGAVDDCVDVRQFVQVLDPMGAAADSLVRVGMAAEADGYEVHPANQPPFRQVKNWPEEKAPRRAVRAKPSRKKAFAGMGIIYLVEAVGSGLAKIGWTTDLETRVASLQTSSPHILAVLATRLGPISAERSLHEQFASLRVHGEWFRLTEEVRSAFEPGLA
jgi:hypothetical protein